ncbi:MAG TPA: Asp-tRNA(Asn)/Glu-tRNA(Gln) amidotransferase subunit GatC [Stellaceae bacterium]|nr:Asp-tRNA(Asn)/Glu-tRNA(Gln) amidotransferase subunit GatC [Stellaceae bacterium]
MALDKATVTRIAALARIRVQEAELDPLQASLSQILGFVDRLAELDTEGVEPKAGVLSGLPMREDVVSDGNCRDRILANAPAAAHGFFTVPKVVE